MNKNKGFLALQDYADKVKLTDRLPEDDIRPVIMGLFGEVGSIMAPTKKLRRGENSPSGYLEAVIEEFGDALWYFSALISRTRFSFADVFSRISENNVDKVVAASDMPEKPIIYIPAQTKIEDLEDALLKLGLSASQFINVEKDNISIEMLSDFAFSYLSATRSANISFAQIISNNITKVYGRFMEVNIEELPDFDKDFDVDERIPREFVIKIRKRANGKCYLQWNDVFIGDPLTDNHKDSDGYQFHDVFHLANAAILHWSPTFRSMIKHKRKSNKYIDETQDGGRAIVIEEGLTAWLYSKAKEFDYFRGKESISFDLLKTIQEFVRGYEVEACPLSLWERAIIEGYKVFLSVQENHGGIIYGNLEERTLRYKPL